MKIDPAVKKTTLQIAAGVLVGTGIMFLVFAMLGKLDYTVILGGLLGDVAAVGNFFLMGLAVQKAAQGAADSAPAEAEAQDEEADQTGEGVESSTGVNQSPMTEAEKRMKRQIQASYSLRMGLLILLALCAALLPCFHVIAFAVPLVMPRIVILLLSFRKQ